MEQLFRWIGAFIEVFAASSIETPLPAKKVELNANTIILLLIVVLPNTVDLIRIIKKYIVG